MTTKEKKYVELEVYTQSDQILIVGRLLGLLTPKEYASIIKTPKLQTKLVTVETTTIADIAKLADVENLRLAVAVKKKDHVTIIKKTLFFTEQLELISHVISDNNITFVSKEGSYILLTEAENE